MRLPFSLLLLACLTSAPAHAHDAWSDGTPVPAWVKRYCCGPEDVHSYDPSEIRLGEEGFILPDYPTPLPYHDPSYQVSGDGRYWAFWRKYPNGEISPVFCFFVPPQGS